MHIEQEMKNPVSDQLTEACVFMASDKYLFLNFLHLSIHIIQQCTKDQVNNLNRVQNQSARIKLQVTTATILITSDYTEEGAHVLWQSILVE